MALTAPKVTAPHSYFFLCWHLDRYQNLELCAAHPIISYDIQIISCTSFSVEMMTVLCQQYPAIRKIGRVDL
jgi:hypothetical protein